MTTRHTIIKGLGDDDAHFNVYIGNRPAFDFNTDTNNIHPMLTGQISACGQACGNGWRKVFNTYAKLVYAGAFSALGVDKYHCWQDYRDQQLLQVNSGTSLIFSSPDFTMSTSHSTIHIIAGRTYAHSLDLPDGFNWLDEEFAINHTYRIIICPYFDYRQLSNVKIVRLIGLIATLASHTDC